MSNTTQAGAAPSEQPSSPVQSQTTRADIPTESRAQTTTVQTSSESSVAAATTSTAGQPTSSSAAVPTSNIPAQETSQAPPAQAPSSAAEQSSSRVTTSQQQSQQPTSAAAQPTSAANSQPASSQPSLVNSDSTEALTTVVTVTPTDGTTAQTSVILVTSTIVGTASQPSSTIGSSARSSATPIGPGSGGSGEGLSQKSKVAIGVVVPIAAIAILAIVGLFFWKKRRARQAAQEERRKEVEDYSYNPNADPTIPNVGMGGDGSYEMREDGSSGYRGWGNTTLGSTGRKASTTMSGGVGQAYSDATSPTMRGNMSDAPLMDGPHSPEGEILGAMGPSTANNRGGDVHRGPSNASSSYSAAGRSENSDGVGITYGAGGTYYDKCAQNNPYNENNYNQQGPPSQPIIRDNPARRNTRIESPSHYPQQSAGISQNF